MILKEVLGVVSSGLVFANCVSLNACFYLLDVLLFMIFCLIRSCHQYLMLNVYLIVKKVVVLLQLQIDSSDLNKRKVHISLVVKHSSSILGI